MLLRAGSLQLQRAGATPRRGARASHRGGLSHCGARAPGVQASVVVAHGLSSCGLRALECRFSSSGARAQPLRGMWDLSRTRAQTRVPCIGRWTPNHCTTREALLIYFFNLLFFFFKREQASHSRHLSGIYQASA